MVQGEANLELTNLTPINFEFGEPVSNLMVTADHQLPIAIDIVVDMSFGSDADLIRDTLRSFFLNYYQADDDVTLYILDGASNLPRVEIIDSLATANQIIDSLEQQELFYRNWHAPCPFCWVYASPNSSLGYSTSSATHLDTRRRKHQHAFSHS